MTNEEKNFLRTYVKTLIKEDRTTKEIISKAKSYGFKEGTIRNYIKAFR